MLYMMNQKTKMEYQMKTNEKYKRLEQKKICNLFNNIFFKIYFYFNRIILKKFFLLHNRNMYFREKYFEYHYFKSKMICVSNK